MKRIIWLCLLGAPGILHAQESLRPALYTGDMNYYNPAVMITDTSFDRSAGLYGKTRIVDNALYERAPVFFANYMARAGRGTYQAGLLRDAYSFYSRTALMGGYSYGWNLGRHHRITAGVRVVANLDNINWGRLKTEFVKTGSSMRLSPDADLGIQYRWKGLRVGLSSKNLVAAGVRDEGEMLLQNRREFVTALSYTFRVAGELEVTPLITAFRERSAKMDAGLHLDYRNTVRAAYLFRVQELRSIITAGVHVWKGLEIGLAYDRSAIYTDHNLDFAVRYQFR